MSPSAKSPHTKSRSTSDDKAEALERALDDLNGYCCEMMFLVLTRMESSKAKVGLRAGLMVNVKNGKSRRAVICYFPKAAKGDTSKFGKGTPYADSIYAPINYCPWCKARLSKEE